MQFNFELTETYVGNHLPSNISLSSFSHWPRSDGVFELQEVLPDVVVMGKSMGNSYPLAAVVTTPEIASAFDNGMDYFNTYGGNPVSMAAGLAILDVLEEEGLQAHAQRVGNHLRQGLRTLRETYPVLGDVRGRGLFVGIELVRDPETREPAGTETSAIVNALKERGILTGTDGPHRNVIKLKPPLVFDTATRTSLSIRSTSCYVICSAEELGTELFHISGLAPPLQRIGQGRDPQGYTYCGKFA